MPLWTAARQGPVSFTISQNLLKCMSVKLVMLSNHLILHRPLLLLPSIFPIVRVFSSELALCISWPKYGSFSISPSSEYSRLISFRVEWFDLAVQGTLKSLLQHHSSKASVLQRSALFMIQFTPLHMTTGKTIALTTLLAKVTFISLSKSGFLSLEPLTLWARKFFVLGAVLCIVGCLEGFMASTHQTLIAPYPPPPPFLNCDHQNCLQTMSHGDKITDQLKH